MNKRSCPDFFRVVIFDPDGEEWARGEDLEHARGMVHGYAEVRGGEGWTYRQEWFSVDCRDSWIDPEVFPLFDSR